jgi:hypothetical protein
MTHTKSNWALHLGHPLSRYATCPCALCKAETARRAAEHKAGNSKASFL